MVTIKEISKVYSGPKAALSNINAQINPGTLLGLVGPNGAGKSTLINIIAGVLRPTKGEVQLAIKDLASLAWVSQSTTLDWYLDVLHNVRLGARLGGVSLSKSYQIADQAMELMQISDLKYANVETISGGQQQRVQIARTLAQQADLLLLDEPTIGLDYYGSIQLMQHLKKLVLQGKTIIISSHNLVLLEEYVDHVWFLKDGVLEVNQPLQQFLLEENYQDTTELTILYQGTLEEQTLEEIQNSGVHILQQSPLKVALPNAVDTNTLLAILLPKIKIYAIKPASMGLEKLYKKH